MLYLVDVIADALLIIIPSQLVYKVRLSRTQKIRIISIFSASAITTVVCRVHAYYVFTNGRLKEAVAALFEVRFLPWLSTWRIVDPVFLGIRELDRGKPQCHCCIPLPYQRRRNRDIFTQGARIYCNLWCTASSTKGAARLSLFSHGGWR